MTNAASTRPTVGLAPEASEPPLGRIRAHLALIANRDLYDPDHIDEVAELSARLGVRLGLVNAEIADVEQVARLRDVGKAMVPIAVLRKEGPLDDAEWALLRRYPEHGALLMATTPGFERLASPVRAGNERWDGEGYPDGLAGKAIPAASRITYVAQAYLAMRADRPYRPAVTRAQAIVEVACASGTQFDPQAVTALVGLLIDEPSGTAPAPSAADRAVAPDPLASSATPIRASVARPPGPARRGRRHRLVSGAGALAGAAVGLMLVLPLPDAAQKCPPGGEGRGICEVKDIAVPALTIVAVCAVVGMVLLGLVLTRLPALLGRRRPAGGMSSRRLDTVTSRSSDA